MNLGDRSAGAHAPSPYFGAAVIATGLIVLVVGVFYLNKTDEPPRLIVPTADGITPPTDSDGRTVEIPPSQPAGMVSFSIDGAVLRPDPVRARVVDSRTGVEILIRLPPNTVVDAVTGAIIPRPPGTSGPTTVTTGPTGSTGSTGGTTPTTPTPTDPPTTPDPTTTTTEPEPTTTTTEPEPTTTTTEPEPTTTTGDTTPPDTTGG